MSGARGIAQRRRRARERLERVWFFWVAIYLALNLC
jgi:hypothetical protein